MSDQPVTVRRIAWRDLAPWLILGRVLGLAVRPEFLALSLIAVLATPIGWRIGDAVFIWKDKQPQEMQDLAERFGTWPGQEARVGVGGAPVWDDLRFEATRLAAPVAKMFDPEVTLAQFAYYVFGTLWTLGLWALCGGAIARMSSVQLGREERIDATEAVRFAAGRYLTFLGAPLFPVAGVILIALPIAILGLIMRLHLGTGAVVAGLFWWLVLIGSCLMSILLAGLLFGWPLMWGVVSCERDGDVFEAFSRSFSYTFQRPLHYLFYVGVAGVIGVLGWFVVYYFSEMVIELAYWSLSWGAGRDQITQLRDASSSTPDSFLWAGLSLMHLFQALVHSVAVAFAYCYFWCAATAIYLLLRRDVDQTEFDDVFVDDEGPTFQMPPLPRADGGVPDLSGSE